MREEPPLPKIEYQRLVTFAVSSTGYSVLHDLAESRGVRVNILMLQLIEEELERNEREAKRLVQRGLAAKG